MLPMLRRTLTLALALLLAVAPSDAAQVPALSSASASGSGSGSGNDIGRARFAQSVTMSGLGAWVDPDTPSDRQSYVTSRGKRWQLVMSDEFSDVYRNFTAGQDHLWTSLEKADGVNGALDYYAHDMTFIHCENGSSTANNTNGNCYMVIKVIDKVKTIHVYNQYMRPPGYMDKTLFYRAGMLQTWNKFCFQGGMLEVRAQLPGAITPKAMNPDMGNASTARVRAGEWYPTWPGIWMMGNLGRAVFSGSTNRMWPFSYNECRPSAFEPHNQRISACNATPGHGLNPYQGRGAPEIDLLEGGGTGISSSIQIGPGLKPAFRRIDRNESDNPYCVYYAGCKQPGANILNVPTAAYEARGHQTWYKGLRYGSNTVCQKDSTEMQTFEMIRASLTAGLTDNSCSVTTCPASNDVINDMSFIDGIAQRGRWGINSQGSCFSVQNSYQGSYLCDPDNTDPLCAEPRNASTPKIKSMDPFNYQMDAVSANWGLHLAAYTSFLTYQLEWVMGDYGYLRWMLDGVPLFEIPAQSIVNGPQDAKLSNPKLTFPEEPMYLVMNVALSDAWGAKPPNTTAPCRGDGSNKKANLVCSGFPMYMKVDYVRIYQDVSEGSNMSVGCNPSTHPTRQWIYDNIKDYTDDENPLLEVAGGATCRYDSDCTIPRNHTFPVASGTCQNGRCVCASDRFTGPRCTMLLLITEQVVKKKPSYGPPVFLAAGVGGAAFLITLGVVIVHTYHRREKEAKIQHREERMRAKMDLASYRFDKATWAEEVELSQQDPTTPLYEYKRQET